MISCVIFVSLVALGGVTTVVLPILGALGQALDKSVTPRVINPGFPARSFEAKAWHAVDKARSW